jgi:single-strand DNA-binding protein
MVKISAIGHLGQDSRVAENNGQHVINFSIASTEKWKDANGEVKEKTTWIDCAYWTKSVAIAQYLKKGTQVYVEGVPEVRTYTSREGEIRPVLSVRILQVKLLGGGNQLGDGTTSAATSGTTSGQGTTSGATSAATRPAEVATPVEDDLPF